MRHLPLAPEYLTMRRYILDQRQPPFTKLASNRYSQCFPHRFLLSSSLTTVRPTIWSFASSCSISPAPNASKTTRRTAAARQAFDTDARHFQLHGTVYSKNKDLASIGGSLSHSRAAHDARSIGTEPGIRGLPTRLFHSRGGSCHPASIRPMMVER